MKTAAKSILILFVFGIISSFISNQEKPDKDLARVQRISGKYIFVLSEPVRDYEVVEDLTTGLTSSMMGRQNIQNQVEEMIKRGNKRVEKGKIDGFDGIIADGDNGYLIKFK